MKILVFLVVCLAVAKASIVYSSDDFSESSDSECFQYTSYFPSTWCNSEYYEPILEVYPDDTCENEDWEETDPSVIVARVENALASSRTSMSLAMTEARDNWLADLDCRIAEKKESYSNYINEFYDYLTECDDTDYTETKAEKINEYNSRLDTNRQTSLDSYNDKIAENLLTIEQYHLDLVQRSSDCLTTRLQKVNEYKEEKIQKVYDGIVEFVRYHLSILDQKKQIYEEALTCLFGDEGNVYANVKADASVQAFYARERLNVENLARSYAFQLSENHKQLVQYYTCAYRCYMSNSCLSFSSTSFDSHCYTLSSVDCDTSYSVTRSYMSPFSYSYDCTQYNDLDTCAIAEEENTAVNTISGLRSQLSQNLAEQRSNYATWKSTWEQNHQEYKDAYDSIATSSHNSYVDRLTEMYASNDGTITAERQEQLNARIAELEIDLADRISDYNSRLDTKMTNAQTKHDERMGDYDEDNNNLINTLESNYNQCAADKATDIQTYEGELIAERDEQRSTLQTRINQLRDDHIADFQDMLVDYHGADYMSHNDVYCMYNSYVDIIDQKVLEVMCAFDAYWATTIPDLVLHYTCNYHCTVSDCDIPAYSAESFYDWTYELPTASDSDC